MGREPLTEKVAFELRLKGGRGGAVQTSGKSTSERGNSRCRRRGDPEAGVGLAGSGHSQAAPVAALQSAGGRAVEEVSEVWAGGQPTWFPQVKWETEGFEQRKFMI